MNTKSILGAILALGVAFAFGRYTAPEKVKIEKEIVTVESTTKEEKKEVKTDAQRDKRVEKVTTEVVRPDGTKETTTRIVEDSKTTRQTDSGTDSREESRKASTEKSSETIEYGRDKLSLSMLAGAPISFTSGLGVIVYGGHIHRNFLGPISIGVWGLSNGTGGFSLGLTL